MVDIGLEFENALRKVVREGKDFERFADVVRGIMPSHLENNREDVEKILRDLAKAMKNWPEWPE